MGETQEDILRKALEAGTYLRRSPFGEPGGWLVDQGLWTDERCFWKWSVSLYGSSDSGTWREVSFTGVPKGYIKQGSENRYAFPLGNLEGRFNYRGLREIVKEGSGKGAYLSLSGTSREGFFTGQHEGYIKDGSGAGHLSPLGSHWGTYRWVVDRELWETDTRRLVKWSVSVYESCVTGT